MSIELISSIAMEKGQSFSIREGGKTVAAGAILEIVE
jgi:elongation factor Tu